jgi:hypothetical protein
VPHKCLHSSATSSCRICTSPPVLHDRACSMVILAPQPSQAAGISGGEWLYHRRTLSLHSSADRPVTFNRFGKTDGHAPAAQFRWSRLATAGLSRPRWSRKICSSWSRSLQAARLLRWRTYDAPSGQTECQDPQGTLSSGELPQERPCEHAGWCPQGCGLPAPPA